MGIDDIPVVGKRVDAEALGAPPPMRCGGCGRMLSPQDTECSRCGRAVGRGTHLRWYLSWAAGLAAASGLVALLGHRRGLTFMAILFVGTLAVGIGAAFVWRARRAQNSQG